MGLRFCAIFYAFSTASLCGVFFGPLFGTIIAGALNSVYYVINIFIDEQRHVNFLILISQILDLCVVALISAFYVYGFPKINCGGNKKLPSILIVYVLYGIAWILYLLLPYDLPPSLILGVAALSICAFCFRKQKYTGNVLMQGVIIGLAVFAGAGITQIFPFSLATNRDGRSLTTLLYLVREPPDWSEPLKTIQMLLSTASAIAIVGALGTVLPAILAKTGLYLGPFVKQKQPIDALPSKVSK